MGRDTFDLVGSDVSMLSGLGLRVKNFMARENVTSWESATGCGGQRMHHAVSMVHAHNFVVRLLLEAGLFRNAEVKKCYIE